MRMDIEGVFLWNPWNKPKNRRFYRWSVAGSAVFWYDKDRKAVLIMDKELFGSFVAELRKEKDWTQKELAEVLFVSDKAVSKWERGLSLPDVSLLMPLAEALGVTVTELLEGKRMDNPQPKSPEQVEELVKTALRLGEDELPMSKGRTWRIVIFAAAVIVVALEWGLLGGIQSESLKVLEGLGIGFGFYFWLFVQERLPDYYDGNRIGSYNHGPIRMNIPGVNFNNRNWPHIVKVMRIWTLTTMLTVPLMTIPQRIIAAIYYGFQIDNLVLIFYLAAMVAGLYWTGKKYE